MAKIIDYTLAQSDSWKALVESVNAGIKNGYQPLGGVAFSESYDGKTFYPQWAQAMVKFEVEKEG